MRSRYFETRLKKKRRNEGGAKSAEEMKRSENDVNSSSNSNTISSSSSEANTEERGKREGGERMRNGNGARHSRIVFPNVVILARREDDTGPWTRVGELEMRGSWYVPIAYSNQAIGVKIMSILITLEPEH